MCAVRGVLLAGLCILTVSCGEETTGPDDAALTMNEAVVTGSVDWQLGGRSGSCDIDLVLSGEPDLSATEPSVAGILSGMLCGHEAEVEVQSLPGPG